MKKTISHFIVPLGIVIICLVAMSSEREYHEEEYRELCREFVSAGQYNYERFDSLEACIDSLETLLETDLPTGAKN